MGKWSTGDGYIDNRTDHIEELGQGGEIKTMKGDSPALG
jgi:hypothetical protein